jgi:hypothetical protein
VNGEDLQFWGGYHVALFAVSEEKEEPFSGAVYTMTRSEDGLWTVEWQTGKWVGTQRIHLYAARNVS